MTAKINCQPKSLESLVALRFSVSNMGRLGKARLGKVRLGRARPVNVRWTKFKYSESELVLVKLNVGPNDTPPSLQHIVNR